MKLIPALFFLEKFIYGSIVDYHGSVETQRWYTWLDKIMEKNNGRT